MTDEESNRLIEMSKNFISKIENLTKNSNVQILILLYDKEDLLPCGLGCPRCAVEACKEFIAENIDTTHNPEKIH